MGVNGGDVFLFWIRDLFGTQHLRVMRRLGCKTHLNHDFGRHFFFLGGGRGGGGGVCVCVCVIIVIY